MAGRNSNTQGFSDLSDEEIFHLVESLNSLHEGELGISMLVACGERAVGFLRQFLLHGKPSSLPQPRQRALRALAELGAKEALLEYLRERRLVSDPAIALGEEAVQNTAARLLATWRTEDVFQELLRCAKRKPMAGVIETLGEFARPEAVPHFIASLGDDVCRRPAEDALRSVGRQAIPALIEAARTPEPNRYFESPSSLLRRQSTVRVLADFDLSAEQWPKLEFLLYESEAAITIPAAVIAFRIAPEAALSVAFRRMNQALPQADWFLQMEAESALLEHFDRLSSFIAADIEARLRPQSENGMHDKVLRVLCAARKKALNREGRCA